MHWASVSASAPNDLALAAAAGGFCMALPLMAAVLSVVGVRSVAKRQKASHGRGLPTQRHFVTIGRLEEGCSPVLKSTCYVVNRRGKWQDQISRIFDKIEGVFANLVVLFRMVVYVARLVVYSLTLAPWFLRLGYAYAVYPHLQRGVRYGPNARNYLDIYLPHSASEGKTEKAPVVVLVMGGAWLIGHRVWNVQFALRLAQAGVLVVGVDYRNFPFAQVSDMVADVEASLDWVFANVEKYGGDVSNMVLAGQSAGAHLQALLLVERALAEEGRSAQPAGAPAAEAAPRPERGGRELCSARASWSIRDFKAWVGVSGVYDLVDVEAHMKPKGFSGLISAMCGAGGVARHSPLQLLRTSPAWRPGALSERAAARFPPVCLFHGEADITVPSRSTSSFAAALRAAGAPVARVEVRPGVTHAWPVIADPFLGGDIQAELVTPFLGRDVMRRLAALPPPQPQPPRALVKFAEYVMPF